MKIEILHPWEIPLSFNNLNEFILKTVNEEEVKRSALNAILASLNEIYLCYFLAGSWKNVEDGNNIEQIILKKTLNLDKKLVEEQVERAKIMAKKVLEWAKENGFEGSVQRVYWTPDPAKLKAAVGSDVSSGNPTDVLIKFSDDSFLGASAKSTKGSGDIGFKNPGIGSLSVKLGINLEKIAFDIEEIYAKEYSLPASRKDRKPFIRSNPDIKSKTEKIGEDILKKLRDYLLSHYKLMELEDVRTHIMSVWLDAKDLFPYYVKVTGRGTGGKYDAAVYDPIKNEKFKSLSADPITFVGLGTNSIGVQVGETKMFKIRFKYESEKLASSIKLSGDPW